MAASPGRTPHDRITGEQAALRRVATLVARAASPDEVFAAVAEEAGRVMDVDFTFLSRYDPDDTATIVASWSGAGAAFSVGTRLSLRRRNLHMLVFQTGQAARIEDYAVSSGPASDLAREFGLRAAVGVPISVEGRLWGVMFVASTGEEPLPPGTDARLAGFTELAATAIANTQARTELRGFADEQAALRRVATLVGHATPPEEVLAAVTAQAARGLVGQGEPMSCPLVVSWSTVPSRFSRCMKAVGGTINRDGRIVRTAAGDRFACAIRRTHVEGTASWPP